MSRKQSTAPQTPRATHLRFSRETSAAWANSSIKSVVTGPLRNCRNMLCQVPTDSISLAHSCTHLAASPVVDAPQQFEFATILASTLTAYARHRDEILHP